MCAPRLAFVVVITALVASACTLRQAAEATHVALGSAVRAAALENDAAYGRVLAREFSMVVPENELKWDTTEPRRGEFNFAPADRIFKFAAGHQMTTRGTPLVWHYQNPAWLQDGTWTRATLGPVLDNHIATVVGHYAGMISQWDVVNEAFNDDGSLRQSVWSRAFGDDYIDRAFRDAHQADPKVALFYNDYNLEWPNAKADAVFAMVSSMRRRGVPIDGVGFQMHAFTGFPTGAQLTEQFARYARIGVETAITELDVRLPVPASQTDLEAQRHAYHDAVRACVDAPNCNTVLVWGFTDKYSWIPEWFPGFGAATVFDQRYTRKPAWSGVLDALTASSTPRATR